MGKKKKGQRCIEAIIITSLVLSKKISLKQIQWHK